MTIKYVAIAVCACILNLVFTALLRDLALKKKLLLVRKVPAIGGIAIGLSFIIISLGALWLGAGIGGPALGIILASSVMLAFGILDDLVELSIPAKFLLQMIAIGVLIALGVRTQIMHIGAAANIAITAFWILGITNAFNHLDIIDGLAGGAAMIASAAFLCLAIASQDTHIIVMACSLIGALVSFLIYNYPPAKVYMGNSGSHLIGFILAAAAPLISYAPREHAMALATPILILGLPLFDTAFLMIMRIGKKKSVFLKSNDHMALRFLKKGYSKTRALLWMLALGVYFALSGIYLMQVPLASAVVVIIAAGVVSFCCMAEMGRVFIDG